MQSSHSFALKPLSLLMSSKPIFSSGVTKEAAFPRRQLWQVWDSRKAMTLAKVLPRPLVKPGDWALHSAVILLSDTCPRFWAGDCSEEPSHQWRRTPRAAFELYFFHLDPLRQVPQRQLHFKDLLVITSSWQQLDQATHSEMRGVSTSPQHPFGTSRQNLIFLPTPGSLLVPGQAQTPAQAGVAKLQALDQKSLRP